MGMCKKCANVVSTIEMTNSYCKECYDSSDESSKINKATVELTEERLKRIEEAYIGVKKEIRVLEKKIKDVGDPEPYHVGHFILSFFTYGIWLVVWLIAVIYSMFSKAKLSEYEVQLEELYELKDELSGA